MPQRAFSRTTSAATTVSNASITAPRGHRDRPGNRSGWFSASSSVRDLVVDKPPGGILELLSSWVVITTIGPARAGFLGPGRITLGVELIWIAGRPGVHY